MKRIKDYLGTSFNENSIYGLFKKEKWPELLCLSRFFFNRSQV